jgi:hypothetical protein
MKKLLLSIIGISVTSMAFAANNNCHTSTKNDPQIKQLTSIVTNFIKDKNEATLQSKIENWYNSNQSYISNLCVGYPEADENYHRNRIVHGNNYDVFIHTMNQYGHTALHGHGLNEVNIIALDHGLTSVDFSAKESDTTSKRKLVTLEKISHTQPSAHTVTEKALNDDMIHFVYNTSGSSIRFLEVYVDEPQDLPIYLPVYNNKNHQFIITYPSEYGYQINKDLFTQIKYNSSIVLQSKSCDEIESYLVNNAKDVSNKKFIMTNTDSAIVDNAGLGEYCQTSNNSSLYTLMYNKKANIYLIDQLL